MNVNQMLIWAINWKWEIIGIHIVLFLGFFSFLILKGLWQNSAYSKELTTHSDNQKETEVYKKDIATFFLADNKGQVHKPKREL